MSSFRETLRLLFKDHRGTMQWNCPKYSKYLSVVIIRQFFNVFWTVSVVRHLFLKLAPYGLNFFNFLTFIVVLCRLKIWQSLFVLWVEVTFFGCVSFSSHIKRWRTRSTALIIELMGFGLPLLPSVCCGKLNFAYCCFVVSFIIFAA